MRIITGEWKGRRIEAAPGTRPTGDRVREALFSILGGTLRGRFVDLYCGGGAVGLEARSRGAETDFVDRDAGAIATLRRNLETLDVVGGVRVIEADVLRYLKGTRAASGASGTTTPTGASDANTEPARVVFADPPYDHRPVGKLLRLLAESALVGPRTTVVLEHRRGRPLPEAPAGLELRRREDYGETSLSFYSRADSAESSERA